MRKTFLVAALAGTALTLTACSGNTDDVADPAAQDALAGVDTDDGMDDTTTGASAVIDANTATAEQLAKTDNVSPELAEAIVAGQPYASVTDLNATLIGTVTQEEAADILTRVFVPVKLNSASREEIKLIPGMTDRMVGEFLEYRPYEDMSEFDREIGKYVDEAEVARFRNYVTL